MDLRETGIILRTRPLTETSLIIHWLTPRSGRLATVAKGALRPKSPFRGKLDLFYLADFSYARSTRSDLHVLKEVSLLKTFPALRENYDLLQQASYISRLIEVSTETESEMAPIYHLTLEFLETISRVPPSPRYVLAYEFKLLERLGFSPAGEQKNAALQKIASQLQQGSWEAIQSASLGGSQGRALAQFMNSFILHHLGRVPSGRNTVMLKGGKQKAAE